MSVFPPAITEADTEVIGVLPHLRDTMSDLLPRTGRPPMPVVPPDTGLRQMLDDRPGSDLRVTGWDGHRRLGHHSIGQALNPVHQEGGVGGDRAVRLIILQRITP